VQVTVQQGNVAGCPEPTKLVSIITAKEPSKVEYHWEAESGGRFGREARDFKDGEQQKVEMNLLREPGGGPVQTGTYSLVIDQGAIDQPEVTVTCRSKP
jgi:hypothetical protein